MAAALTAGPILGGTAYAQAFFHIETLPVNQGDTWKLTCSARATHCISVITCDTFPQGANRFEHVLVAIAPPQLIGKTVHGIAVNNGPDVDEGCSTIQMCRSGTATGPMQALAVITHPSGSGMSYTLAIACEDKDGRGIPGLTVTQTEFGN